MWAAMATMVARADRARRRRPAAGSTAGDTRRRASGRHPGRRGLLVRRRADCQDRALPRSGSGSPGRRARRRLELVRARVADVVGDEAERVDAAIERLAGLTPGEADDASPRCRGRPGRASSGARPRDSGRRSSSRRPRSARASRGTTQGRRGGGGRRPRRAADQPPAGRLRAPAEVEVAGRADALGEAAELLERGPPDQQVAVGAAPPSTAGRADAALAVVEAARAAYAASSDSWPGEAVDRPRQQPASSGAGAAK